MTRVDAAVSLLLIGGALITELLLIFALVWLWTHRVKPWLRALAWRHRMEWQQWSDGVQARQDDRIDTCPDFDTHADQAIAVANSRTYSADPIGLERWSLREMQDFDEWDAEWEKKQ